MINTEDIGRLKNGVFFLAEKKSLLVLRKKSLGSFHKTSVVVFFSGGGIGHHGHERPVAGLEIDPHQLGDQEASRA